jgi:hypothetical protein
MMRLGSLRSTFNTSTDLQNYFTCKLRLQFVTSQIRRTLQASVEPATVLKLNSRTNDETTQRFGKIKRAATNRTKPTLCSTFDFAPTTRQTKIY